MTEEEKRTYEAAADELDAVRLLCSALARLFSYPDLDAAAVFTDGQSLNFLERLAQEAHLGDAVSVSVAQGCKAVANGEADARAERMRREFTRLFYRPNAPVPIEGRRSVRRVSTDVERKLGETASVLHQYRASGLKMRPDVSERADSLPTELDFAAFLLERETRFGREGNGAAALTWKRRRLHFAERHLAPLARAVVVGIREYADWPPLLYWAALLEAVATRCMY